MSTPGLTNADEMQALLDAGYTTVLSGGGPAEGNITLRDHIESGQIRGPRIIPSGRLDLAESSTEQVRAETRRLAALGIQWLGEMSLTPKPGPTPKELENLRALLDEARKVDVHVQIHAVSPQSMMAAVDAGVKKLVHTPHFGWLTFEEAQARRRSGRAGAVHDRLRRSCVRRVRGRQPAALSRRHDRGPSRFCKAMAADRRPATRPSTRARSGTRVSSTATAPTPTTSRKPGSRTSCAL